MDRENRIDCRKANELDLVNYLADLGFQPSKIRGSNYWYHSPLREEKTPSFKVSPKLNMWYDFGIAEGGTLIDFGIRYFNCSVGEFLGRLDGHLGHPSFIDNHSKASLNSDALFKAGNLDSHIASATNEETIHIISVAPLSSAALLDYLASRKIDLDVAKAHCKQVYFSLYGKYYFGIGFGNQSGGYEIRNSFQKYASSPKDFTLIKNGSDKVLVFEGFMDFLSYLTVMDRPTATIQDFLVLNGIGLFERARAEMERYGYKGLFLDQDKAGREMTAYALKLDKAYVDESSLYAPHKDLNEWLMKEGRKELESREISGGLPRSCKRQDEPLYHNGILPAGKPPSLLRSRKGPSRGRRTKM